jgi:hypothetical protein
VPATEKADRQVLVHSKRPLTSLTPYTEWRKRVLEDEHTMVLGEPVREGSCRVSMKRRRMETRRS